jgi:Na+/H+ antiporter NhaD/arsenite permease-like protein
MRQVLKTSYFFFITLPDRLYPFRVEVEGQWVRGQRAYQEAVMEQVENLHRLGYKLTLYREVFHFFGSVVFIALAAFLSHEFLGGDSALYALFVAAVVALAYQEFYVHPKMYDQHPQKGILDWSVWVAPMAVYLFLIK